MTTLNNSKREIILSRLLKHRFEKEDAAMEAKRAALAVRIYDDAFPKKQRDLMATLPDGWLPTVDTISFVAAGDWKRLRLPNERRIPLSRKNAAAKAYDADHPIAEAVADLEAKDAELRARRDECRFNVRAMLASANTVAALVKTWPEVAPFVTIAEGMRAALPAVNLSDLNASLALPAKGKRAEGVAA